MWIETFPSDEITQYETILSGFNDKIFGLIVLVKNKTEIFSIAIKWEEDGIWKITQYFFEDNTPGGFHTININSPNWPLNRPPLSDTYYAHLLSLTIQVPPLSENLIKCINWLREPGLMYSKD